MNSFCSSCPEAGYVVSSLAWNSRRDLYFLNEHLCLKAVCDGVNKKQVPVENSFGILFPDFQGKNKLFLFLIFGPSLE